MLDCRHFFVTDLESLPLKVRYEVYRVVGEKKYGLLGEQFRVEN